MSSIWGDPENIHSLGVLPPVTQTRPFASASGPHPAIIAEGFLRYVESLNHGSRLFPAYTEHNIFKDLAAFYDRLGITKRDYYSLRRTLHTHYRFQDGIDPDVKAYLLGHGKKDAHPKYGKYSGTKLLPSVKTIRSL